MVYPVRRDALKARARIDDVDALSRFNRETPAERVLLGLELTELARALAQAARAPWLSNPVELSEKARRYTAPLRAVWTAK